MIISSRSNLLLGIGLFWSCAPWRKIESISALRLKTLVPVQISKRTLNFLLDTGSTDSAIDPGVA
jgi:hypothetical protein